jgi:hypothetical protein
MAAWNGNAYATGISTSSIVTWTPTFTGTTTITATSLGANGFPLSGATTHTWTVTLQGGGGGGYAWPAYREPEPADAEEARQWREEREARLDRENAERERWQVEARERRERESLERVRADARAEELLLTLLTPAQRERYEASDEFEMIGSLGTIYQIGKGSNGNITWVDAEGGFGGRLCAHPSMHNTGRLPDADVAVAQLLALTTDEGAFLRKVNVHAGRMPPVALD